MPLLMSVSWLVLVDLVTGLADVEVFFFVFEGFQTSLGSGVN